MNRKELADWLEYIEALHPEEIELGLTRIKQVANRLELLNPSAKVLLVGGTNGKGSCCAMLESLAVQQSLSVGCYTSPHLIRFNERIKINQNEVDAPTLVSAFEAIEKAKLNLELTFFEFTTLAALYIFKQSNLDLIILEVGLGGRQDACNIIEPDLSIITTIDIDHTSWLGNTLPEIAFEKAGILRREKLGLVGDNKSYQLLLNTPGINFEKLQLVSAPRDEIQALFLENSTNKFQLLDQNLTLAIEAFQHVTLTTLSVAQISNALLGIKLAGRFQLLAKSPLVIVDVAHNQQSANNLKKQLTHFVNERDIKHVAVICGMMKDKAIAEVLNILSEIVDAWYFVDLPGNRAAKGVELEASLKHIDKDSVTECYPEVSDAFVAFQGSQQKDGLLLVFGSFITVGEMLQHFQSQKI